MVYRTVVRVPLLAGQPIFTVTRFRIKHRNIKNAEDVKRINKT